MDASLNTEIDIENPIENPTFELSEATKDLQEKREIIQTERNFCYKTLLELLVQCKEHKKILDMRYGDIYQYLTYIQTSVIILSTVSSFVQALGSKIYISEKAEFLVSLLITTYISLILSLSKFFKLEEKKESIHNLKEKFAELHNKIRFRLDTLKPWGSPDFINENDYKEKYDTWSTEKGYTYNDYYKIIEGKQSLFMEFEKLIDSKLKNKYLVVMNKDLKTKEKIMKKTAGIETRIQKEDMDEHEEIKTNDTDKFKNHHLPSLTHFT